MDGEGNVAEGAGASACCLLLLLLLLSLMMAQIHVVVAKAMQNKKVGSTEHRARVEGWLESFLNERKQSESRPASAGAARKPPEKLPKTKK